MKKIFLLFIVVLFTANSGFSKRVKGPVEIKKRDTIIVEKIVEVQAPSNSTTIINNVNINVGACESTYTSQTITYCAGHNGCSKMSNIEVLMAIDPSMSVQCRGLAQNSKLTAINIGMGVHKRCFLAHGIYDLNKKVCQFIVDLRKGKKVKETATVWEGKDYICGKDLFPMASKFRRNAIIGGGLAGATVGAIGGGFLNQRVIAYNKNVKQVLRDECGVSEDKIKSLTKNIKKKKQTTVSDLIDDLDRHNISDTKWTNCVAELNREAFYGELKTKLNNTKVIIQRELDKMTKKEVLTVTFNGKTSFIFSYNKSNIIEEGKDVLDVIAKFLNEHSCVNINIEGWTSGDGTDAHNLKLSQKRAESVKTYLISKNVKEDQIGEPKGMGKVLPNDGTDNKPDRHAKLILDTNSCATEEIVHDKTYENDVFEDDDEINIKRNRFYKKSDFVKGAVVGGTTLGLAGAGLGALLTKYKCYISGTDNVLAKWRKTFKITP